MLYSTIQFAWIICELFWILCYFFQNGFYVLFFRYQSIMNFELVCFVDFFFIFQKKNQKDNKKSEEIIFWKMANMKIIWFTFFIPFHSLPDFDWNAFATTNAYIQFPCKERWFFFINCSTKRNRTKHLYILRWKSKYFQMHSN